MAMQVCGRLLGSGGGHFLRQLADTASRSGHSIGHNIGHRIGHMAPFCPRRCLSATPFRPYKYQSDSENTYAHSVLERIPGYEATLCVGVDMEAVGQLGAEMRPDFEGISPSQVLEEWKEVSQYSAKCPQDITDPKFDALCKAVCDSCSLWDTQQLQSGLQSLSMWAETESTRSHNYMEVWNALDSACCALVKRMAVDDLLRTCDQWYQLGLGRISRFSGLATLRLASKPNRLSPQGLVQAMFYVNLRRGNLHKSLNMYEFEHVFQKMFESLSMEEVSVVAMGFFKTQTPIRNPQLVAAIIDMAAKNLPSAQQIPLCALLKVIRKSLKVEHVPAIKDLLKRSIDCIPQLSLATSLQLLLVGSNYQVFEREVVGAVVSNFLVHIKSARLKELERLGFVVTSCLLQDGLGQAAMDAIATELRRPERAEEIDRHPQVFVSTLHFLLFRTPFPKDLLETVANPENITKWYGKNPYVIRREVLMIDMTLEIEWSQFPTRCMDEKTRNQVMKHKMGWIPEVTKERMPNSYVKLWDIKKTIDGMCHNVSDGQFTQLMFVLPHFLTADVVFCMDVNGKLVPLPESFIGQKSTSVKHPVPDSVGRWCCVVYLGRGAFLRDTSLPLGITQLKARHIRTLGYTLIQVPWYEWEVEPQETREDYLRRKIDAAIHEIPEEGDEVVGGS